MNAWRRHHFRPLGSSSFPSYPPPVTTGVRVLLLGVTDVGPSVRLWVCPCAEIVSFSAVTPPYYVRFTRSTDRDIPVPGEGRVCLLCA